MNVPQSFVDLVYSADNHQNYIGMGNPNAKILIIGREPAHIIDSEGHHQDIELNRENWKNLIEGKPYIGRCNPRRPHPHQRCFLQNKSGQGTAMTWVNYQKLIDRILGRIYEMPYGIRPVDFHDFCFHTDISAASAPGQGEVEDESKRKSVLERSEQLFSQPFFLQFPLIILAIGGDMGKYVSTEWCRDVLGLPTNECIREKDPLIWLNEDKATHRTLIHTMQLSRAMDTEGHPHIQMIRDAILCATPERPNRSNPQFYWPQLY